MTISKNSKSMSLFLEDGSRFQGHMFGAETQSTGEVVFNTSMTGYQEMCTDPSYRGQILTLTYPIIGNYGVNTDNLESQSVQIRGLVVRQVCDAPSHKMARGTLSNYLIENGKPAISGLDTRKLTKHLRIKGVMMGILTPEDDLKVAMDLLNSTPKYGTEHVALEASTESNSIHGCRWIGDESGKAFYDLRKRALPPAHTTDFSKRLTIVVVDYGVKLNILRSLRARNCDVFVEGIHASQDEIMRHNPDGIVLSPGPGDPAMIKQAAIIAKSLALSGIAVLGICLGHQVLARAFEAKTFKLPFGHRGGNQPVKDLETGRVYVTAHNHGYAVDGDTLPSGWRVTHINLNDETVEGITHDTLPVMTMQYHSEASPGPHDSEYMFDRFVRMVANNHGRKRH